MGKEQTFCRNCDSPLQGEYCAQCGQREGKSDVHLSEVVGDLADDFLHWDSRIWRTLLALLFRPGFLTAEFIAGRKARYVPAFRLYLVVSFALFLVLSLEAGPLRVDSVAPPSGNQSIAAGSTETSVAPSVITSDGTVALDPEINIELSDEESPQWLKDLDQRLQENSERIVKEPGDFLAKLIEHLPQTMFVMLPLFAFLVMLCYLFSPFHYLQHLVFSLHLHSFVYLLSVLSSVAGWILPESITDLLFLPIFFYLPLALRRAYGSGLPGAIGKSLFILGADVILLLFGLAGAALFTLVML